jgi:hypothetical protein
VGQSSPWGRQWRKAHCTFSVCQTGHRPEHYVGNHKGKRAVIEVACAWFAPASSALFMARCYRARTLQALALFDVAWGVV